MSSVELSARMRDGPLRSSNAALPSCRWRPTAGLLRIGPATCSEIVGEREEIHDRGEPMVFSPRMSNEVLEFWFDPASRRYWFDASPEFDELVRNRLASLYADAIEARLDHWSDHPDGALALCILLDQAPRNMFRGSARAFASDAMARSVARRILAWGFDRSYPTDDHRVFCYLPFEHSEDIEDQRLALRLLNERTADENAIESARRHLEIIARFGRFPHRNAALGRSSTSAELEFLKEPGSSF